MTDRTSCPPRSPYRSRYPQTPRCTSEITLPPRLRMFSASPSPNFGITPRRQCTSGSTIPLMKLGHILQHMCKTLAHLGIRRYQLITSNFSTVSFLSKYSITLVMFTYGEPGTFHEPPQKFSPSLRHFRKNPRRLTARQASPAFPSRVAASAPPPEARAPAARPGRPSKQ